MANRLQLALVIALLGLGTARDVAAEGSAEVGNLSRIQPSTAFRIDILSPAVETISWTGQGTLAIREPGGAAVATLSSGQAATLTGRPTGAYQATMSVQQTGAWNVAVNNAAAPGGRCA
jgi:hypothetical protein